ncbi:hypothetical protein BDP27DRAFT_1360542 [Rhodocollybia butyracea]|uniref:Uncharacterized protein n=1 Tax=Rhodocollybia butyracea TaxID=206335 RepID=A0A9P5Q0Z9_9AGAR|nr:hypothetical protein BDP27DRAFT_1360542 [Rhodocollybia butyracea]
MSSKASFRSFTVFVDTPASPKPNLKNSAPVPLSRSFSESSISTTLSPIAPDKENLDPVTGERVVSSTVLGKKRKGSISVLAVKPVPTESKSLKEKDLSGLEAQPESKKRRSSVSSSSSKLKVKKTTSSAKKAAKRPSRRTSPMPKLDEETELDKEQARVTQALIDSKCYDLTVRPLADVTVAYEEATEDEEPFHFVKEASADPEIRDRDFLPSKSLSASSSTTLRGSSPAEMKTFSTPNANKSILRLLSRLLLPLASVSQTACALPACPS